MDAKAVQMIVIPPHEKPDHPVQVGKLPLICQPDPAPNRGMNIPQKHLQLQQPWSQTGHQPDRSSSTPGLAPGL